MSETRQLTAGGTISHLLKGCVSQTEKAIKSCPENKRYFQLADNKATPIWLIGHMANTAEFIGNSIGLGSSSGAIKPEWRSKFTPDGFGGDKITSNPADYPKWEEVVEAYKKAFGHLIQEAAGLTDEQLLGPPKGKVPPPLAGMLTNLQDCMTLNIIHDSHHRGQFGLLAAAPK